MHWKSYLAAVVFLLSVLTVGQNVGKTSNQATNQTQEEQFQLRRQNFDSGRQLLLNKGVPFDPDELLRDQWSKDLKTKLDSMPEMHQTRYERAPLNGAYLADTLYLPEKVRLSGHTVILANYVVFEGKNPVIKGNFDLHFFPAKPVTVLDTTLAKLMRQRPELLRVRFDHRKPALPSFVLIQDLVQTRRHEITFDTSGLEPQVLRSAPHKLMARQQTISWNQLVPTMVSLQDCPTGCDHSGDTGATGTNGAPGTPGINGPHQPPAANGDCSSPSTGSNNGGNGENAGAAGTGGNGGPGGTGGRGFDATIINAQVADNDLNQYRFIANGGTGGLGGEGGPGGAGGNGGFGGNGGDGVACGCSVGSGGGAGSGTSGKNGGTGGPGGSGGPGGNGATITVSLPFNSPGATTQNSGGQGGLGGSGGSGGSGGLAGFAGSPGAGAAACGQTGATGPAASGGDSGNSGNSGNTGANGQTGTAGPPPSISFRPDPSGGGGGGGGDPCLGSGGGGFQPGSGTAPDPVCSPIIIDTEREGFRLTSAVTGVSFDISGSGHSVQMGWTDAHYHNAFLALPSADGLVHTGKELFGNFTPQPASAHPNGFIALAQYDKPENGGNGDGIIDDHDEVFSKLRLWIDENHDGICQPNELHRLPELGIYSLSLSYGESRRTDEFGNVFRYRGRVNPGGRRDARDETPTGEPGRWEYDVFLTIK